MFYKLVNVSNFSGRILYFGRFGFSFGIYLISARLQCPHCALTERMGYLTRNTIQNHLDLIYRTFLYDLVFIVF